MKAKLFSKLGVVCVGLSVMASSALAGTALTPEQTSALVKDNKILANPNVTVEKVEKASENVNVLKLKVKYQTQQGVTDRPAQAFIVKVDGKDYTFLGGGFDQNGEKLNISLDAKVINEGALWSHGTGPEVIYLVTNPSCPWCQKFEKAATESADFYKKYTVKTFFMPFHANAEEKAAYVLAGKTDAEKAERYKKMMVDNDESWKSFKPTPEETAKYKAVMAKTSDATREFGAEGTPAVFDSKFNPIQNWPDLMGLK